MALDEPNAVSSASVEQAHSTENREAPPEVSRHPPRPRLTLNLCITGHRAQVLPEPVIAMVQPIVDGIFRELRDATMRLHDAETAIFDAATPLLRLHTPLASGADQVGARSARLSGYHVRALLPFAPDEYRKDFNEGSERDQFNRELEAASEVFALPGERANEEEAYVLVGKAVVAAADILVAIWDGKGGNGPGGTAHVVDMALTHAVPIIHVGIDHDGQPTDVRLLVGGDAVEPVTKAIDSPEAYDALIRETLAPHTHLEREQLAAYFREREKDINLRLEYSVLLSLLDVKRMPKRPWRQASIIEDITHDWHGVHAVGPEGARRSLAVAYAWSNFLAIRYAQMFRSGHITNYFLSALAVLIALLGLLFPGVKVFLVMAELATIGLLFYNTNAGRKGEWHRRWLQYRHLAESLRPLMYLKRSGMISTPFRSDYVRGPTNREAGADWTRWYAAAVWREMDSPQGIVTPQVVRQLADDVLKEQILPQAEYHHVNSERMHKLDHRLHEIGNFLMGAVIAACGMFLIGYYPMHHWVKELTAPFIFLTAGLPALGAAVFGMRGHGEHLLAASRSANTSTELMANAERLKDATKLETVALELQNTARIMLADLNEWTVTYSERSLEIPA